MNLDPMEFIQEKIYLKNKRWDIFNKSYEYADVGTHWIALYCKHVETIYFDSFGIEYVLKEIEKFIRHKIIKTNMFRIQSNN